MHNTRKRGVSIKKIPVLYDDRMVADSECFSPSAAKPAAVVEDWLANGLPIEIVPFEPLKIDDLTIAHSAKFVRGIFSGTIRNGHGGRSRALADSTLWTTGSHYHAAKRALADGVACSTTSGFHHAGYRDCGGFCTFNGLMVSAMRLIAEKKVGRVGIVDYDYHYGDGTDNIIRQLNVEDRIEQINSPYDRSVSFLRNITRDIESLEADVIFYQAGADQHINDPLGGILTTRQMRERDEIVFRYCKDSGTPVVWNLAGGYQREPDGSIPKVLRIHRNTMEACQAAHCDSGTAV